MDNTQPIYLITVFEKCEYEHHYGAFLGDSRSVGFRYTLEKAEEIVKKNTCDIFEGCYYYACIEELGCELYPHSYKRWFYEYNPEIDGYTEIPEPAVLTHYSPIGGIG